MRGISQTEGVKTLLGDPEKAIWKLSLPMIIAMSMQTIYNVVDAFWVSGLGKFALTAVGLFFSILFYDTCLSYWSRNRWWFRNIKKDRCR